ncbi:MAG: type III-B CRISPR module-associated protein Cmr3 [Thiomonas sp.]|uniref:type III-B CRISPR module-associated protein Cmr3 n=1 Tax=Thiomonas sp. TaxID=2047785 RepID=UPI002A363CC5|nr:type III-B CRISPR module-associated protein Cmr3 [Thiomonas sp.]MDY0331673.1 type III-B CRISPR module-associated protein Cmr3 [Thiomonas sp.]
MNTLHTRFIEPLDVLILRGNKLFGDPGSYGEALVPPWPSVAAGAIRSRMLADEGVDLTAFAKGLVNHPSLGAPAQPGSFTLAAFHLARRKADDAVEVLTAPPADLSVVEDEHGKPAARLSRPNSLADGIASAHPLPLHPVLAETTRAKPTSGYWLTQAGFERYLNGKPPAPEHLLKSSELWRMDERVGVGLSVEQRRADDGKLFSLQAIAFKPGVGFLAGISGATPPESGLLRFGGDGRGAAIRAIEHRPPALDYAAMAQAQRCRLVLTTPGLFRQGWLPNGITPTGNDYRFDLHGVRGRLVCAAVPRAEVISGWDLANWTPKPAQRVAPTGSVYWLDELQARPEALEKLASEGLWSVPCEDATRRAEGFNRFTFAAY